MMLTHYTESPVTLDRSRVYTQLEHGVGVYEKPHGLWVSVDGDDDWPAWCRGEEFRVNTLAVAHRVLLADQANVLTLTTPAALRDFTVEYGVAPDYRWPGKERQAIHWGSVAADFDGIIIAPYQWSQRYDLDWYYGWDCASGCIWNLAAISEFTPFASTRQADRGKPWSVPA